MEERWGLEGQTYRSPDKTSITRGDNDTQSHSSLLFCLSTRGTDPAKNNTVDSVGTDCKNHHCNVSSCDVVDGKSQNETKDGESFSNSYMPSSLVALA